MADIDSGEMQLLAWNIAREAHKHQVDKSGVAYIRHPLRVSMMVAEFGPEHSAAALLHDVVEDTEITLDDLRRRGMPERVVQAVDALTHREGETRKDYYARVLLDPIALVVKRADIADNTSPTRMAHLDDATAERLYRKYEEATSILGRWKESDV